MDYLLKSIANFIGNLEYGMISSSLTGIIDFFQKIMKACITNSLIIASHNSVLGISMSLIILFCVKQYFDTYVMETSGDPEADPLDILVRGSRAAAMAAGSTWFFYTFMNFCSAFAEKILTNNGEPEFILGFNQALDGLMGNLTVKGFIWLLFLFAVLIGIIVFYIIAALRAAELSLMFIIVPLFTTELCYTSHERLNGLLTNIVVTGMYFSFQLLLFNLFLNQLVDSLFGITASSSMDSNTYVTIGFLIATLRSPKWLDLFAYNSGVGDMAKRSIATVTTSMVRGFFMRR